MHKRTPTCTKSYIMAVSRSDNYSYCFVRGYHVYQTVWVPVVGEVLNCLREVGNVIDRYSVRHWSLQK